MRVVNNELILTRSPDSFYWDFEAYTETLKDQFDAITSIRVVDYLYGSAHSAESLVHERSGLYSETELANFLRSLPNLQAIIFQGRLCDYNEAGVINYFRSIKIMIRDIRYKPDDIYMGDLSRKFGYPNLIVDYKPHLMAIHPTDLICLIRSCLTITSLS